MPFVASGDAGASAPTEVIINLVIFVPFGLFIGALAPTWAWWKAGGTVLAASLVLEGVQHVISTGSAALALAAVVLFVASPLHFGPQRDVVVERQ